MVMKYLRVKRLRCLRIFRDNLHDLVCQLVRFLIASVDLVRVIHQQIGAFRQPHDSEHGKEFIPGNKTLSGKERGLEEIRFFHEEPDSLVHIVPHALQTVRKGLRQKLFSALCLRNQLRKDDSRQCVGTASNGQNVVTAGNAVVPIRILVHPVVADGRIRAVKGGIERQLPIGVRRNIRIIFQCQVRNRILKLFFQLQDDPSGSRLLRAQICMAEPVSNGPVQINQEQSQLFLRFLVAHTFEKRFDQAVDAAKINGITGDGGHMAVQNLQELNHLVKILRRVKLQKFTPFFHRRFVIRHDISWPVRRMAFVQVTDSSGLHIVTGLLRYLQYLQTVLRRMGQGHHLLFIRQSLRCHNV